MSSIQQALYDRLVEFQIDEPGTELTFARRLARENGWTIGYAERLIEEYKRFLFLACEAGHVVSPSEQVDQAWHLHLTYTRSYWDELCGKVLGNPLHHMPTKGGASEQAKFIDLYNQTLVSYQRFFGLAPPADIWPPASQRFGEDLQHLNVNTARYWIIPKPRWQSGQVSQSPVFALGLLGMPLAAATWNPLDWRGPNFLGFYLLLMIVAAITALIVRILFAPAEPRDGISKTPPLDAYEAACLASGPYRAVQTAFAALVQSGNLKVVDCCSQKLFIFDLTRGTIQQAAAPAPSAHRLERALYEAAAMPTESIEPLVGAGLPIAHDIENDLTKRGLMQAAVPSASCFAASLIMASPLPLGLVKIAVGVSQHRPVIFVIAACVATVIAALVFLLVRSRLTSRGKAALQSLQQTYALQELPDKVGMAAIQPSNLAMTVGLFGVPLLAGSTLDAVHAILPRASTNGGCGGGGCGGGGGGGGGGCGGGGCGGGCGGCGGG